MRMQNIRWLSVVVREASPQALVKTQPAIPVAFQPEFDYAHPSGAVRAEQIRIWETL